VSRVGGAAQISAMKKIAGPLRIELAQYRELASFAQFGSDLSKDTLERLKHGERIVEMLKQPQYEPLQVEYQVLLLFMLTRKYFAEVNVERVSMTADDYLRYIKENHQDIADEIRDKQVISSELEEKIKSAAEEFVKTLS